MKKLIWALVYAFALSQFSQFANAASRPGAKSSGSGGSSFLVEAAYDIDSVSATDLNSARKSFLWNNTTPSSGTINRLSGFGVSLGYRFFDPVYLILRYESFSQTLPTTTISGASYTIADSFTYKPILLLADLPFHLFDSLVISLRAGLGYAAEFQFAQQNTGGNGELVKWVANPIPIRAGLTVNYKFADFVGLFAEAYYESVKASKLTAASNYSTTISGNPIVSGQTLPDANTGSAVAVDISGTHLGAGLRVEF